MRYLSHASLPRASRTNRVCVHSANPLRTSFQAVKFKQRVGLERRAVLEQRGSILTTILDHRVARAPPRVHFKRFDFGTWPFCPGVCSTRVILGRLCIVLMRVGAFVSLHALHVHHPHS